MLNYFEESKINNSKLPVEWQSQASLDELALFLQHNWEQRAVFYDDGQVTSRQQFLEFGGQKSIRTKNYIGTIVFKGQQLNIFPKVFRTEKEDNERDDLDVRHLMRNLVKWIEYCSKIDYPYISITSDLEDSDDFRELFITLYIRYVKNVLDRGLYYRYEEQTEDCVVIKGKVDFKDYFTKKYPNGQSDKFSCTYSTFEFDNILNRIIKYTCKGLMNDASKTNQKIIRHILAKLNDVTDCMCTPHDCDTIRLSRLHKHYAIILSMSKMFLLNKTSSYNIDDTESFCFLFPTEVLFEGFVAGYMQHVLEGTARVKTQVKQGLLTKGLMAGREYNVNLLIRPDIIVEHVNKGIVVLDTKYKGIDKLEDLLGNNKLSNEIFSGDVYQVLVYAMRNGRKDVFLLYPQYRLEDYPGEIVELPVPLGTPNGDQYIINVHIARIPFVFEEENNKTADNLRKAIYSIFE